MDSALLTGGKMLVVGAQTLLDVRGSPTEVEDFDAMCSDRN